MSTTRPDPPLAAVLDLDGVITRTAALHREAWKRTFDEYLRANHPAQPPFDAESDYTSYVDGMPRLDGVRTFLESRGIDAPEGEPGDSVEDGTVFGIGNTKNGRYNALLRERGAEVFEDAVDRIRSWTSRGMPVAVVSSSRNCRAVLESVGLLDLFDARVDGETIAALGLPGKPAPDMYEEAARRLGVEPAQCVLVEDALSGVEAGRRGGFGLVVGVDRTGAHAEALRERGADTVVRTLEELRDEQS